MRANQKAVFRTFSEKGFPLIPLVLFPVGKIQITRKIQLSSRLYSGDHTHTHTHTVHGLHAGSAKTKKIPTFLVYHFGIITRAGNILRGRGQQHLWGHHFGGWGNFREKLFHCPLGQMPSVAIFVLFGQNRRKLEMSMEHVFFFSLLQSKAAFYSKDKVKIVNTGKQQYIYGVPRCANKYQVY